MKGLVVRFEQSIQHMLHPAAQIRAPRSPKHIFLRLRTKRDPVQQGFPAALFRITGAISCAVLRAGQGPQQSFRALGKCRNSGSKACASLAPWVWTCAGLYPRFVIPRCAIDSLIESAAYQHTCMTLRNRLFEASL